jgi:hypothetical protein
MTATMFVHCTPGRTAAMTDGRGMGAAYAKANRSLQSSDEIGAKIGKGDKLS